MALKPHEAPGGEILSITNDDIINLHRPAAVPDGRRSYWIKLSNFFAAINLSLANMGNSLSAFNLRIELLENALSIDKSSSDITGAFTKVFAADTLIEFFAFTKLTGAPSVSVGTTVGGTDIINAQSVDTFYIKRKDIICAASTTLYFTVTGGHVSLTIKSIKKLHY